MLDYLAVGMVVLAFVVLLRKGTFRHEQQEVPSSLDETEFIDRVVEFLEFSKSAMIIRNSTQILILKGDKTFAFDQEGIKDVSDSYRRIGQPAHNKKPQHKQHKPQRMLTDPETGEQVAL